MAVASNAQLWALFLTSVSRGSSAASAHPSQLPAPVEHNHHLCSLTCLLYTPRVAPALACRMVRDAAIFILAFLQFFFGQNIVSLTMIAALALGVLGILVRFIFQR